MSLRGSRSTVPRGDDSVLQVLRRQGPVTSDELPRGVSTHDREYVGKFDVDRPDTGRRMSEDDTDEVYYLYGDERRAVRRYIERNTEFIDNCIGDSDNPISINREDYWWRMFQEEWYWGGYDDG